MGNKIIKNLYENVFMDSGTASIMAIRSVENKYDIKLPIVYANFIIKHNCAYLNADCFNYDDPNTNRINCDSITFENVKKIIENINLLQFGEAEELDIKYRFEDGLIPFGENGGGDMICFDYRKNKNTDNPPIVIWNHDMGLDHRVVFVANNFEDFVNMLYEPKD